MPKELLLKNWLNKYRVKSFQIIDQGDYYYRILYIDPLCASASNVEIIDKD